MTDTEPERSTTFGSNEEEENQPLGLDPQMHKPCRKFNSIEAQF